MSVAPLELARFIQIRCKEQLWLRTFWMAVRSDNQYLLVRDRLRWPRKRAGSIFMTESDRCRIDVRLILVSTQKILRRVRGESYEGFVVMSPDLN